MKVSVSRHAHFNAAHRLHNPDWSDEENEKIFGKCSNSAYHGHNYELIVSVRGDVDPSTGYVMDMKELSDLIKDQIEERFDHKNLNEQTEEFKNTIPTAENIAIAIWNILRQFIPRDLQLKVTLYETPRNFVEYEGIE
ncbi:MAG: 6-carboxytetrahydropterin synthase [Bacteroidota bacterium]|nr:6-carboxytetrahydropterin synthase [Bacteroidota bacterium]